MGHLFGSVMTHPGPRSYLVLPTQANCNIPLGALYGIGMNKKEACCVRRVSNLSKSCPSDEVV